jgi:hypothetical protein
LRDEAMSKYIDRLRSVFQIPISYCTFSLGDTLPGALERPRAARRSKHP